MLKEILFEALKLLFSFDHELYVIVFTTFKVVLCSTILAGFISIPLALVISLLNFRLKKFLIAFFNSLLAVPTVVIGLFVYVIISNTGPLGQCQLLFTPYAIIIGQTILAVPIITSFILAGFSKTDKLLFETIITMGANKFDMLITLIVEHKALIVSSVLAGFGRVIAEVGISMMLGGNIKGFTRTITTAIALETTKGEFALGLSLGLLLIIIAIIVNFVIHYLIRNDYILRPS